MRFKAVIDLQSNDTDLVNNIKRLALFFDEIHFIMPRGAIIEQEVLEDTSKFKRHKGMIEILDFNFFRDVSYGGISLVLNSSFGNEEISDLLAALKEKGIAKEATYEGTKNEKEHIKQLLDNLVLLDIQDERYNEILKVKEEDYDIAKMLNQGKNITVQSESGKLENFKVVFPPDTINNSYDISYNCVVSNIIDGVSIFPLKAQKESIKYKYDKYRLNLKAISEKYPNLLSFSDFNLHFGEVSFSLFNRVITSDSISKLSINEILKYREALDESRRLFLSKNLIEISELITENPWNNKTKNEINKFILSKLNQQILDYEAKTELTWRKMYGSISVQLTNISQAAILGGGAAGMLGSIVPNTSTLGMILLGAMGGAIKDSPKVVKSIADAYIESKNNSKSSIAYIANLMKLNTNK